MPFFTGKPAFYTSVSADRRRRTRLPCTDSMEPPPSQHPKKKRCISKQRRSYVQQKDAARGYGMGSSKREQFYRDRDIEHMAKQHTLAAAQQQLAAQQQQVSVKRDQLMQTSRIKFREADAAKAQANREWALANSLITDELGGGKLSRALALETRLVDTGYVDLPAARRAVAAKFAQDGVDSSRLSVLPKGIDIWYFDSGGRPSPAKISRVDLDDDQVPYYTIIFDNGHERDTERNRIVPM